MPTKVKVTLVVPEQLQNEMKYLVIAEKYGMRGKSKWVSEAIEAFLQLEEFPELVSLADEMKGLEKSESIMIDIRLKKSIDAAALAIRKAYPLLEGVQSRIIRASILQRIIRS
jgi:hypothetical protein